MKPRRNQPEDTGFAPVSMPPTLQKGIETTSTPPANDFSAPTATGALVPPGFGQEEEAPPPKRHKPEPEKIDNGPLPADFQSTLAEIRVCEARQRGRLNRHEQLATNARVNRLKQHLKALQNTPPAPWTGSERLAAESARHSALGLDQARKLITLANS